MRRLGFLLVWLGLAAAARGQVVVDRIVARVENNIITASEVEELARFQQLVNGHSESDAKLIDQLIEQWVVRTEAAATGFPEPSAGDVTLALERLGKQFPSPEAFRGRLRELDLSEAAVRRMLRAQIYLGRYIDYKFRPVVQIERGAVEKYYREEFMPGLQAKGEAVPPLSAVREQIGELLTQKQISERAARWLEESKSRLRIERTGAGDAR
jgi:parvulin-like peptidyl-prolyl isomerase